MLIANKWFIISGIIVVVLIVLAVRLVQVGQSVGKLRSYWSEQNRNVPAGDHIKILALGDSVVQGVGASSFDKTLAGRIQDYVRDQTGKDVHTINLSVTGATVGDVVRNQLPTADLQAADMIILVASANDAFQKTPVDQYERDLAKLLAALPPGKTLMADMPWVRHRSDYLPSLHRLAKEYGFSLVSHDIDEPKSRLPFVYVAGDFLHPSDRGYKDIWFHSYKLHLDGTLERLKTGAT